MLPRPMDLNPREEVILALPARHRVPMSTQFRSTWLASSLHALRDRGLYDRYVASLPPAFVEPITSCIAGVWLPIEMACAHYAACDRLDLPASDLVSIGTQVMLHTHRTVLAITMRLATAAGATPWTIFPHAQRLWDRNWVGAAVGVTKTGLREARMELVGWPCARYAYCRIGIRGVVSGLIELFCEKAHVTEIPPLCTPPSIGFRVAWV
jgi:hypothetical protein